MFACRGTMPKVLPTTEKSIPQLERVKKQIEDKIAAE